MKRVYHLALTILVASFTILGLLSYIYSDRISAFFAAKEVLTERQNKLPRFHIPLSKWRPKASPTASDIHFDCEDQFRFTLLGDNCTKYKDESQHVQAWSCPDSPAHKGILVSFIPTCRYPFSPKGNVAGAKCLIRIQKLLSWSENDLSLLMTEKEIRYFLADGALRGLSLPQNVEAPEAIVRKNRLHPDQNRVVLFSELETSSPGFISSDPHRVALASGNLSIQRYCRFEGHPGPVESDPVEPPPIETTRLFRPGSLADFDSLDTQTVGSSAGRGCRIRKGDDHSMDAGVQDGVDAWGGLAMVGTGLEGDIECAPPGSLPGIFQSDGLRVRTAKNRVKAFACE